MKRIILLLIFILLLISFVVAVDNSCCNIQQSQNPTGCDAIDTPWARESCKLFTNWETAAVLALIISAIIVSLTYLISIGFEIPDLKVWAGTELSQIISTAIIIATLISVLMLINSIVVIIVNESNMHGLSCSPMDNCLNKTTAFYFDKYIKEARNNALLALQDSVNNMEEASRRYNSYCSQVILPIPCLQYGMGVGSLNAGEAILNAERAAIVFEYYQNLLSSMEAQNFFVTKVSYSIGPILLALGILGRSFFFTRRLGGLLIAIAIGIMVVLPLMYIFDWLAMQVTLYGDLPFSYSTNTDCPEECQQQIPVAYAYGVTNVIKFNDTRELINIIFEGLKDSNCCSDEQNMKLATEIAINLTSGQIESYVVPKINMKIVSCEAEAEKNKVEGISQDSIDNYTCEVPCRILPYPYGNGECAKYITQYACSKLTDNCKAIRLVKNIDTRQYESCPTKCRIIPPLKNNCISSPAEAGFPPSITPKELLSPLVDMCLNSRFDCRVWYRDGTWVAKKEIDELEAKMKKAKKEEKNIYAATIEKCSFAQNCYKPYNYNEDIGINDTKTSIAKALEIAKNSCAYIYPIPNDPECSNCLVLEKAYLYNPPLRSEDECASLCSSKPSGKQKIGDKVLLLVEGNVGPTILTNLSKLLIPVYLLPLFNILVTVMFIRSFSRFLGGDIEIPGLAKVL